jgi:hypothetical protein
MHLRDAFYCGAIDRSKAAFGAKAGNFWKNT